MGYRSQANMLVRRGVENIGWDLFTTRDVIKEIEKIIEKENIELIVTPITTLSFRTEGGHTLLDFPDRVRKRLNTMYLRGKLERVTFGRYGAHHYSRVK